MASDDAPVSGPDLTAGVPAADIAEGGTLLGHADGEAVVLARCDGRLYAVGASCPHYGGPLAEGLVVDGTIRCPWHHAAFRLDGGDLERPPALQGLACWQVEERDGRARVVGPRASGARPARASTAHPASVVIVGGGAAGAAAVITLREEGYTGPITLVSAERSVPVDRPNLSKDYLAGNAPEEWIPLRPESWYAEQGVTLHLGRRATALDTAARRVQLDDGTAIGYDALLLATGADPVRLPLGDGAPVHYLRTLADSRAIIQAAERGGRAVVLGASFIGLEVAASLRTRGLDVTVVAPESQPLERVLGAELGRFVRELHEAHGVRFRLGRTAASVAEGSVRLDDGSTLPAELVVAGVGVRPNLALAEAAGLALDRGVVVDERLETSAPGVYAAGDAARWPDPYTGQAIRVEHWVVAERMARTAARNILGADERFAAVPFFWSAHYDVSINYVGHAERPDRVEVDGDPRAHDCTVRYHEGGRVAAVATIGRDRAALEAEAAMERELRQVGAGRAA
ncbi:MAG TPA: FAD-dependent oxidoreductase [Gemmatimonadaceae bacterium]|nr:FAD-dependent oxidoreductase [Gemmatimonadaceae bacterium]